MGGSTRASVLLVAVRATSFSACAACFSSHVVVLMTTLVEVPTLAVVTFVCVPYYSEFLTLESGAVMIDEFVDVCVRAMM